MLDYLKRIPATILVILISLDQLAQTLIVGTLYICGGHHKPAPDETISSIVGRRALEGKKWALVAQVIINGIFLIFGEKDHCYHAIEILDTKKYPA